MSDHAAKCGAARVTTRMQCAGRTRVGAERASACPRASAQRSERCTHTWFWWCADPRSGRSRSYAACSSWRAHRNQQHGRKYMNDLIIKRHLCRTSVSGARVQPRHHPTPISAQPGPGPRALRHTATHRAAYMLLILLTSLTHRYARVSAMQRRMNDGTPRALKDDYCRRKLAPPHQAAPAWRQRVTYQQEPAREQRRRVGRAYCQDGTREG